MPVTEKGREFNRENVGVILGFVGIGSKLVIPLMARLQYPVWEKVLRSYGIPTRISSKIIEKMKLAYPSWEENSFPGSIGNVVSGQGCQPVRPGRDQLRGGRGLRQFAGCHPHGCQ